MENFPSNSNEPRRIHPEKPEEKRVFKVIEGDAIRRKKTLGTRFREMFLGGDTKGVFEYVIGDVMVPALKDLIADSVSQGIERMIFGENRENRPSRRTASRPSAFGSSNVVNYTRYASNRRDERTRPPSGTIRSRASHAFDDVILDTRAEAEKVLDTLNDLIKRHVFATVRDLYECVGENFHHVDEKWGWYNLDSAYIRKISSGYLLSLPEVDEISD